MITNERRSKIQVFFAGSGLARDQLAAAVAGVAAEVDKAGITARALIRVADDIFGQGARTDNVVDPGFAAVLQIAATDGERSLEELADIAATLAPTVAGADLGKSSVVAGTDHRLLEDSPDATLELVVAVRRRKDLSPQECHQYWRWSHGPLATGVPGIAGYHQHHTDPAATAALTHRLGTSADYFDGAAEIVFTDRAAVEKAMDSPVISKDLYEDEKQFMDHSRSTLGLYSTDAASSQGVFRL